MRLEIERMNMANAVTEQTFETEVLASEQPVHEHDGAAQPAAEGEEAEAEQREDERASLHGGVGIAAVADEDGDQEEDRRRQHRGHVQGRRLPQRRAPFDRE